MKVIGEKLNIGKITTYVARHTYATVLRNEGVPVSIISPMLGHTSITTTEIYLADLESENRARKCPILFELFNVRISLNFWQVKHTVRFSCLVENRAFFMQNYRCESLIQVKNIVKIPFSFIFR